MSAAHSNSSSSAKRILIVGGVAGGATAAARARRIDEHAEIIVFEKDQHVSFANCGLPYYLGGEIQEHDKLLVAPAEHLRRRLRLDVRTRSEVIEINRDAKTIDVLDRDADRRYTERYDKLILAPGASPIVPDMDGADAAGVFTLRNIEDTDTIDAWLDRPGIDRVVVMGGGYIGLEMAEQMKHRGFAVTLVERNPQVLTLMDAEMVEPVENELRQRGIDLRLSDPAVSIQVEGDKVAGVTFASGARVDCQAVILGVGVRPNTNLAEAAGLRLGDSGGIAVDTFARTSDPDIYAIGDAAEYFYAPADRNMRVPLAGPANRAGRIAGEHAASGKSEPLPTVMGTAIVRVFDVVAGITGLSLSAAKKFGVDATAVTIIAGHHVGYYPGAETMTLKLIYEPQTGRILGGQAIGGEGVDKRIDVIATAMRFGGTVRDLAGVDLCYAPPFGAAKDPVHMAALAATNELDGLVRVKQPGDDLSGCVVIDVRSDAEVKKMSFPDADGAEVIHIPLDELRDRLDEVPRDRCLVTSCASGLRSYNAARILMQHGFDDVCNLSGAATLRKRARAERFPKSVSK